MSNATIEIDIDGCKGRALDTLGLLVPPVHWLKTPRGVHVKYRITGLPDWYDPAWWQTGHGSDEPVPAEPRYHRERRNEFDRLLADLLAGCVDGYDRGAPLHNLRSHGKKYVRNGACPVTEYPLAALLDRADGFGAKGFEPATEAQVDALAEYGYAPNGRYTREKCPFDDHSSGGEGKGTCVHVMPDGSGLFCRGDHTDSVRPDSSRWIGTPALLDRLTGERTPANNPTGPMLPVRKWAGTTPDLRHAIIGLWSVWQLHEPEVTEGRAVTVVAALRMRRMLDDLMPRPSSWIDYSCALSWDADIREVVQYLPDEAKLDRSVSEAVRIPDLVRAHPSLLMWEVSEDAPHGGNWAPNTADGKAVFDADISRANRNGMVRTRCSPVPKFLEPASTTGWVTDRGTPVRVILPTETAHTKPGRTQAADLLRGLLERVPIPEGMADSDAAALRLCYLLPVLTETCPGLMPLVFLAGGTGSGKGITVEAIRKCWKHHGEGNLMAGTPDEIDNRLIADRQGAIWLLDEANGNETDDNGTYRSAVGPKVMAHLKSVMTMPLHAVRLFHNQKMAKLRMVHAWFACARTMTAIGGSNEDDWQRRVIPIQFPQARCTPAYRTEMRDFVADFRPMRVAQLMGVMLDGFTWDDLNERWSLAWPDSMPGWQILAGGLAPMLGLDDLNREEISGRIEKDDSAVELFREWWRTTPDDAARHDGLTFRPGSEYRDGETHVARFKAVTDYARSQRSYSLAKASTLRDALIRQTTGGKFDVDGGQVTVYVSGKPQWRFVPSVGGPSINEINAEADRFLDNCNKIIEADVGPAMPDLFAGRKWNGLAQPDPSGTYRFTREDPNDATEKHGSCERIAPADSPLAAFASASWGGLNQAKERIEDDGTTRTPAEGRHDTADAGPDDHAGGQVPGVPLAAFSGQGAGLLLSRATDRGRAGTGEPLEGREATGAKHGVPGAVDGTTDGEGEGVGEEVPADESAALERPALRADAPRVDVGTTQSDIGVMLRHGIYVDFESYSPVDLNSDGAYKYWQHPDAHATCMVAVWYDPKGDEPAVYIWTPTPIKSDRLVGLVPPEIAKRHLGGNVEARMYSGPECPEILRRAAEGGVPFIAHNCQFDARAWRACGWPEPVGGWYDTMHATRALLLLGGLGDALKKCYGHGKEPSPGWLPWRKMAAGKRRQLVRYCAVDAIPTASLGRDLFPQMTDEQLIASKRDFEMNDRGLPIDRDLAHALQTVNDLMVAQQEREIADLTADDPAGQVTAKVLKSGKQLGDWFKAHGLILAKTDKGAWSTASGTLEHARDGREDTKDHEWATSNPASRQLCIAVINARLKTAGIAGAKAAAAIKFSGDENAETDGRARDQVSHGAASTGRAAGRFIQPHNLPRGHPKITPEDVAEALEILHSIETGGDS